MRKYIAKGFQMKVSLIGMYGKIVDTTLYTLKGGLGNLIVQDGVLEQQLTLMTLK